VKLGHVVVDIQLQNGCVGGLDVCNKIPEGDCVESFCGVIKGNVVYIVNGRLELVACDGGYDEVGVPCLLFGEVGGACLFAGGSGGRGVDQILGGSCRWDVECGPIALKVLKEAKLSFSMSPRARNGHEFGG
jgi:hypothetical protein